MLSLASQPDLKRSVASPGLQKPAASVAAMASML
jgi:hypothetical protein